MFNTSIQNISITLQFNANNAYSYIEDQLNINTTHFRIPVSQGREECAEYFISKFDEINSRL